MMISDSRKAANALGGKTARACDGCLRKRARWYCAADDAFLCQACDASVHSANQLASRHERVRLQTASSNRTNQVHDAPPAWHQGFTRKARTPRPNNKLAQSNTLGQTKLDEGFKVFDLNPLLHHPLVPEMGSEEGSVDENEEQMLCRVPVFDPFAAELSNMVSTSDQGQAGGAWENMDEGFNDLLPSDIDIDLAEFAADVESLLGVELDQETKPTDQSLLDGKEMEDVGESNNVCFQQQHKIVMRVKDEDEGITEACCFDSALRESLNWSLDLGEGEMEEEEEEKGVVPAVSEAAEMEMEMEMKRKKMLLRLNYESVITAWATQRSPWTTGSRPQLNPDDDFIMGKEVGDDEAGGGGGAYGGGGGRRNITDGEREARVSRYREKRRTRLFSKKIRYEVRKLNAEKRPRMKGRFVKRTNTMPMPPAYPNYSHLIH